MIVDQRISRSRARNRCGGQQPCSAPKSKRGRRPQRPGNQFALARVSGVSADGSFFRIAGRCWLCRNHSAGSESPRFSLPLTFRQFLAACNKKTRCPCAEAVDAASSLWMAEEN